MILAFGLKNDLSVFNSIRSKLILLFSILLFFTCFIVGAFFWYENQKNNIAYITSTLKEINYNIKDASRLEKDFFMYESINPKFYDTGKSTFLNEHRNVHNKIITDIGAFQDVKQFRTKETVKNLNYIEKQLNKHQTIFDSLIILIQKRGFQDYGLIGRMRENIHAVEHADKIKYDRAKMLMIRRHEKDYLLRKQSKYIAKLHTAVQALRKDIQEKNPPGKHRKKLLNNLYNYQTYFKQLIKVDSKIGYHSGKGLRASIDSVSASIEKKLVCINSEVNYTAQKIGIRIKATFLAVIFLGIVLNIILIFFVIKKFGNPISRLSDSIHRVIKSNFQKGTEIVKISTNDEIGALSKDFNRMLNKVHQRTDEVINEKERAEEAYRNIKKLSEIGLKVTANLTISKIIHTVYDNMKQLLDCHAVALGIQNKEKNGLDFYGMESDETDIREGFDSLDDASNFSVYCFRNQEEIVINDFYSDYKKFISTVPNEEVNKNYASVLYLPLSTYQKKIGVITVKSLKKNSYQEHHLNILRNLALYISIALENAGAYRQINEQNEEIIAQTNHIKEANRKILIANRTLEQQKEEIQMQAERLEKANEELERLSIVARKTDNAVVITDAEGNFEWVNEGFERMFGTSLHDLITTKGKNIIGSKTPMNIRHTIQRCINEKETVKYEFSAHSKDDDIIWVQATLTPILDEYGNVERLVAIDSDITKIKEAEIEISVQKETLELQNEEIKKQRNVLQDKNVRIEKQNELIKGSIRYAKTIQQAILPRKKEIKEHFDFFKIFRPRDIVSGDFYWYAKVTHNGNPLHLMAVVDCTGHGVPGAFMSMIGNQLLDEIIFEKRVYSPCEILDLLDQRIKKALRQDESDNNDGMDVCLCVFEKQSGEQDGVQTNNFEYSYRITFAGAKRPLFYYEQQGGDEIKTIKGSRKSIGGVRSVRSNIEFENNEIFLKKNDILYLTTDGFIDQPGPNRRRFGTKRFLQVLEENISLDLKTQRKQLIRELNNYQQDTEQRDDITIVGLKL